MEDVKGIKAFLSTGSGSGDGDGVGSGFGGGDGYGYGSGSGNGDDYGYGYGDDYGYGYGHGDGSGYGDDYGYGYGYGNGDGDGDGDGISYFQGQKVFYIDGVSTLIDRVKGDIAKGRILLSDFTTQSCYIVKRDNIFAHGETLRKAISALNDKLFEDMPEEARIAAFVDAHSKNKAYPNMDFFKWHHRLTGSCEQGRKAFAKNHNIDLAGEMTVSEFIKLTANDYGGETIRKLKDFYR